MIFTLLICNWNEELEMRNVLRSWDTVSWTSIKLSVSHIYTEIVIEF